MRGMISSLLMLSVLGSNATTTTAAPGQTLFTSIAQSCNGAPLNASNTTYCLTVHDHPTTLCRYPEPSCSTGERVAASLHTWSSEATNCSTYAWTWACSSLTDAPTAAPTSPPTRSPTEYPTHTPTAAPTALPTHSPTLLPTSVPTTAPTLSPTSEPTDVPTAAVSGTSDEQEERWYEVWWHWFLIAIGAVLVVLWVGCMCYACCTKDQRRVSPTPGGRRLAVQNTIYERPGHDEITI